VVAIDGERGHVGQNFVHAAVLAVEHFLETVVGNILRGGVYPVHELHEDVERLFAASMQMCIAQAGEHLVRGVPGHARKGLARQAVDERGHAVGERGQPAAGPGLALGEIGNDVVHALGEARVIRRFVRTRGRGEVVPQRMTVAADLDPGIHGFPPAVHGGLGLQARIRAKVMQHAVGLEPQ
jgi:hypothetical protein